MCPACTSECFSQFCAKQLPAPLAKFQLQAGFVVVCLVSQEYCIHADCVGSFISSRDRVNNFLYFAIFPVWHVEFHTLNDAYHRSGHDLLWFCYQLL